MSNGAQDLLVRGIAAAKAKEGKEARFYLEWVLTSDPSLDQQIEAWLWLSDLSQDPVEKRSWLEMVLGNNPGEPRARRNLAILDGRLALADLIDPDKIKRPDGEIRRTDQVQRFTCPQCGAAMVFSPDGQSLLCEHCRSQETITARPGTGTEQDFILALATTRGHLEPVNRRIFNCKGCGMEFILPPERITANCPYCESAHVVIDQKDKAIIPPGGIIPFSVTRQEAQQALKFWFHDHAIYPVSVKGIGLYIPAWLFNLGGTIGWRGWREEKRRLEAVEGNNPIGYYDVLVPAGFKGNKQLDDELQNFNLSDICAFDNRYLANIAAETYQVPLADASLVARQIVLQNEKRNISSSIMGEVRDLTVNPAGMFVDSYKLVLFPVWIAHYTSEEERYHVVVNGQTAHVCGERTGCGASGWFKGWGVG